MQLRRNCMAKAQGAVAEVVYKVPSGPAHNVLVNQIREVAKSLGHVVKVIRI